MHQQSKPAIKAILSEMQSYSLHKSLVKEKRSKSSNTPFYSFLQYTVYTYHCPVSNANIWVLSLTKAESEI